MSRRSGRCIRIAVLIALRPRKLGSLEVWMLRFARDAWRRGHHVDFFARSPIHPDLQTALAEGGTGVHPLDDLAARPLRSALHLARAYDLLHLNLLAPRDRAALVAYAAWPARVLFVDHISGPPGRTPADGRIRRALDRFTVLRVTSIAGVSDYVRDRDRARFARADVRTIHNGVDLERFQPPVSRTRENSTLRIIAAANLIPEKGLEHLLRAVALLEPGSVDLCIVGDGPQADQLQGIARELGIEGCTSFLGLRNDVADLLRKADVFVHPAVWAEAFGLTIAEAMATSCAVVATRTGGIPELIADEESGLLVAPGDVRGLADCLRRLQWQPELRQRLGSAARARAARYFDLANCVQRHLDWCEEVMAAPRRMR